MSQLAGLLLANITYYATTACRGYKIYLFIYLRFTIKRKQKYPGQSCSQVLHQSVWDSINRQIKSEIAKNSNLDLHILHSSHNSHWRR